MERLSEKLTDVLRECIDALSQVEEDIIKMALNRLAAYEDTGLEPEEFKKAFNEDALLKMTAQYLGTTPDRLHEWAKADKEGR
jgi:23S rRNA maturation mini-RNase III